MRGKERETGLIINSNAGNRLGRNQVLRSVMDFSQNPQTFELEDLENGNLKNIPGKIVIIGGDGTIRATISWLASHDEYPNIYIAGGGSTNTFRTALLGEGAKTSPELIKQDRERLIEYRPAVIEDENGERQFWVISAGLGDFEKDFAIAFEKVRKSKIPQRARAYAAGVISLAQNFLSAMSSREPLLRAYVTSQRLGPLKVLRKNQISLSCNNLGIVEIDKKDYYWPFLKGLLASCFWQMNLKAPEQLAKTEVRASFSTEIKGSGDFTQVNLDGDEKQVKPGKLNIRRHDQSFPTSALIWDRRSQG